MRVGGWKLENKNKGAECKKKILESGICPTKPH